MLRKNRRSKKIFFSSIGILTIISLISGIFIYRHERESEKVEKILEIESLSLFKIQQISEWYFDELNDADVISKNQTLINEVELVVNGSETSDKSRIIEMILELQSEHGYQHVFIKNSDNKIIIGDTSLKSPEGTLIQPLLHNNFASSGLYISGNGELHFDIVANLLKDNLGNPFFIVFRINPDEVLFPILSFFPEYNESYETFLFAAKHDSLTIVNELLTSKTLKTGKTYSFNQIIASDSPQSEGIYIGTDYKGKKVLAFFEPIVGTPWMLMSKVDEAEVYRNFNRQALLSLLLIAMVIISLSITLSFLYSKRERNIYKYLWQAQEEFKTTLYSIGDGVIITDMEGNVTLMNKEAEELTGWKEAEAVNRKLEEIFLIINEYSRDFQENPVDLVFRKGTVVGMANHSLLISKSGAEIPIADSAAPIKDESGGTIGVVLIFRDQTIERKREAELVESEEKYYRMFADSPQPMWIYDLETLAFLEVNESAVIHYGYSREEFLKMTIKDIRPPEDIEKLLIDVSLTKSPYNDAGIWKHLKKNGDIIYVNIKSHEVNYNKRIARHVLANDITQIKIAQDALQESEQKFRNLFENHSAVKLILDPETGIIADANQAAAEFYGYSREDLIGLHINKINVLDEGAIKQEIKNALDRTKIHFEFTHRCSDGTMKDVSVFSSRIITGGKEFLHSIVHDVTEQKKAKQQVRLLIQSIEQSPVGIMITNPEGFVEFANSRMTDITGHTKEEIVGSLSRILISSKNNQALLKRIWSTIRSGNIWKGEFEDRKKDGIAYWAKIAISPILDEENVVKHYIMVFEDISEQKKILSELISAKIKAEESDHLKTAFLANMSHEIRTPMNGILGFMDLLQQPGLSGDQLEEYIRIVKTSGERLLSTINDIIDISKIEAGQSMFNESVVDVNQLLSEQHIFFKPEAEKKGIELSISLLPSEAQFIKTDHKKLSSVIINLVKNALKFTRKGAIRFGASLKRNEIEFFVTDTGKGIAPERISSIFDRFVQADVSIARDYEGSGLGLSIARAYVEMMGGKIAVSSKVDVGSSFIFTIPFVHVPNENLTIVKPAIDSYLTLDNKVILIAEDDEISFIYINRMLSPFKLKLLRAYNGEEAVEMAEQNPEISLILMDIKMPIMDGYQATRKIRETLPNLPIIALTAFAFSDDKEKAISAGCSDYLSKPVKKENLLDTIRRYINKQVMA